MKIRGPIITLFAVAALAVVLLALNVTTFNQTAGPATGAAPPLTDQPAPDPPLLDPPLADPAETTPPPTTPPLIAADEQVTYAGRTSGNEATIAIAVRDDEAAAYVCDGSSVEAWLEGTNTDGEFTLEGANGAIATGTVEGDAVFGTVRVDGEELPYAAQLASSPAGLYQSSATVDGTPNRIGWIVLPDGSQVGIRNNNGTRVPAPALNPEALGSVIVDGTRIQPQRVAGDTQVVGVPGGPPA